MHVEIFINMNGLSAEISLKKVVYVWKAIKPEFWGPSVSQSDPQ